MGVEVRVDCAARVMVEDLHDLAVWVIDQLLLDPQCELSVLCVDPEPMADLHEEWMAEPGPTDVLSFPMDELRPGRPEDPRPIGLLGDVVLCPAVAAQQAAAAGHDAQHEMRVLLTHGILHLLGYDHVEPHEEVEMFGLQNDLVRRFAATRGLEPEVGADPSADRT